MRSFAIVVVTVLALAGCSRKDANANADANAGANANANASGAILDGKLVVEAAAPVVAAVSYGGKYTVSAGTMYVPEHKDWSSVKWKNDDTKMLGDGEMALSVEPSGRVSGSTEGGPLGAAIIDGMREGEVVTATIRRKDPADEGLTGTLVAKLGGDALEGTMKLAESNAAVVRFARFEAKKKK